MPRKMPAKTTCSDQAMVQDAESPLNNPLHHFCTDNQGCPE